MKFIDLLSKNKNVFTTFLNIDKYFLGKEVLIIMKKIFFIIIAIFFVIVTVGYFWEYQNYNVPDHNVPSYKSASSLAKIRSGELPEQSYWCYRDEQYIWIGPENGPISQSHPIVLDDVKRGVPVDFKMTTNFQMDVIYGTLKNVETCQRWSFFLGDKSTRDFPAGEYVYVATKPGQDYESYGGFTTWPRFEGQKIN